MRPSPKRKRKEGKEGTGWELLQHLSQHARAIAIDEADANPQPRYPRTRRSHQMSAPNVPNFDERATQLRKIYEEIERMAGATYEDEAAKHMAEATTFMVAAVKCSWLAGLGRHDLILMAKSVVDDIYCIEGDG
jgi:hypothetical protein